MRNNNPTGFAPGDTVRVHGDGFTVTGTLLEDEAGWRVWNQQLGSHVVPQDWDRVELVDAAQAPTGPDWEGALLVLDQDGDPWQLEEGSRYRYGDMELSASDLEERFGPCMVLLDEAGRVPFGTYLDSHGAQPTIGTRIMDLTNPVLEDMSGGPEGVSLTIRCGGMKLRVVE